MNVLDQDGLQKLVSDINSRAVQSMSVDGNVLTYKKIDGSTDTVELGAAVVSAATSSNNGYVKFSNGIIIQWGRGNSMVEQSLPVSFSTTTYQTVITHRMSSESGGGTSSGIYDVNASTIFGRTSDTTSDGFNYIAAGI